MNPVLRQGSALLIVVGLTGCKPPEPPVLAPAATPAAIAPARLPASNDDVADRPFEDAPQDTPPADETDAPAVVLVALDHAGDVVIGQRFSDVEADGSWHSAGLSEGDGAGACEYYERGSLPEGVSMMVDAGHVQRFDLDTIDGSYEAIAQPGPFGLRLGMSLDEALKRLPPGSTRTPHAYDPDVGEYLTWQDPGSDLAIRLEIFGGVISKLYWGASGAVELKEGCA
ncbi:hypothetical protein [Stenotrophomonas sp. PS02300]|uniref:hypothetical protein n=1 Tax=Stenotrophomonas sp. PS02300 TaxID=2991426 RepID=UPI002499BAF7|nr:hypothetical protein [Stenotrophomonas sp. PS02300]